MLRICWDLTEKRVILTYHMFCKRLQQHRGEPRMEIHLGCRISSLSLKRRSPTDKAGINPANLTPPQQPQGTCPSSTQAPSGAKAEVSWAGWGDPGLSPDFATHPGTPLSELHHPWCHLPWSQFLHLTVGKSNRAVKTLRNNWEQAVTTLQSAWKIAALSEDARLDPNTTGDFLFWFVSPLPKWCLACCKRPQIRCQQRQGRCTFITFLSEGKSRNLYCCKHSLATDTMPDHPSDFLTFAKPREHVTLPRCSCSTETGQSPRTTLWNMTVTKKLLILQLQSKFLGMR